ncbi:MULTISPECIES: hypothetical protein [Paracoccus]|uniref:hypothetical protein n=1 Tax=Paracoccus TaxID=265 RepID=UPI001F067E2B|nr:MULTISPECIES: hypothetical protein [Paracoccus]
MVAVAVVQIYLVDPIYKRIVSIAEGLADQKTRVFGAIYGFIRIKIEQIVIAYKNEIECYRHGSP